jgi:hypothetical protein
VLDPKAFDYENDSIHEDAASTVKTLVEELQLYTKSYLVLKEQ